MWTISTTVVTTMTTTAIQMTHRQSRIRASTTESSSSGWLSASPMSLAFQSHGPRTPASGFAEPNRADASRASTIGNGDHDRDERDDGRDEPPDVDAPSTRHAVLLSASEHIDRGRHRCRNGNAGSSHGARSDRTVPDPVTVLPASVIVTATVTASAPHLDRRDRAAHLVAVEQRRRRRDRRRPCGGLSSTVSPRRTAAPGRVPPAPRARRLERDRLRGRAIRHAAIDVARQPHQAEEREREDEGDPGDEPRTAVPA